MAKTKVTKSKPKPSISDTVEAFDDLEILVEQVTPEALPPPPYVPGTKKVFTYHPESGEFTGETIADESPLEPGVWHLPAYSTDVTPPDYQTGMIRVWNGQSWEFKAAEVKASNGSVDEDNAAAIVRQRNALLAASDWTQLSDAPHSDYEAEKWRYYRQALRDITKQEGFPKSVVWPTPPTT
ncbi:MAG: tail fiber assembly protein [Flavobacteriales bacterium]|jgi:hypothetical protein